MITIIIPVYNGEHVIGACLQSIFVSKIEDPFEVIVVDDGSTDRTSHIVRQFPCHYYRIDKSGVAAARNVGIKNAQGEIIFFFDADVMVKEDTIKKFLAHFEEDQDAYIIQGRWDKYSPSQTFSSRLLLLKYRYFFVDRFNGNKRIEVANLETGCLAMRAEVLKLFAGFEEGYKFSGGEEYELGIRLVEKYEIFYYDDLFVAHSFGSIRGTVKKIYRRTINFTLLSFESTDRKTFMRRNQVTVPTQEKICLIIIALLLGSSLLFFVDVRWLIWTWSLLGFCYLSTIAKFLIFLVTEEHLFFAIAGAFAHFIIMLPRLFGVCKAIYLFYILKRREYRI